MRQWTDGRDASRTFRAMMAFDLWLRRFPRPGDRRLTRSQREARSPWLGMAAFFVAATALTAALVAMPMFMCLGAGAMAP